MRSARRIITSVMEGIFGKIQNRIMYKIWGIIPSGLCIVFTSFHSIFVGMFGPQENLLHLSLRRRFESSASYLVNTFLNRYEHVLLEKARNEDTAAELANKSGLKTLEAQIRRKTVRTTRKLYTVYLVYVFL